MKRIVIRPEDVGKPLRQYLAEQGVSAVMAEHPVIKKLAGAKTENAKPRRKWRPAVKSLKNQPGRIRIEINGW